MGLKKTLKKVAKTVAKAAPVALLAATAMKKKKPLVKKYFGNSGAPGDANVAANIANWNAGMDRMGSFNEEGNSGLAYKAKGGLVKKGKPKLAKRGWK